MKRVIAGVAVVAAAVFGGANAFDDNTVRDESGVIVEGGGLGAFAMRVGDCVNLPDNPLIASLEAVPCADPHDAEVYALFDLADGGYPGENTVSDASIDGCLDRFEGFVGTPYEFSELDIYWLEPTEDSWNELDDREVVCTVVNLDGSKLTGSMGGSRV